jgi:iron complex transport system substrate-binding protein
MAFRNLLRAAVAALVVVLAACGGDDAAEPDAPSTSSALSDATTATPATTTAPEATVAPAASTTAPAATTAATTGPPIASSERIVAIGEEWVLADLLALGVTPIASTATVADVGLQGIEGFDLSVIEVLPATELSLEQLAALRPDRIVTLQFWVDQVGASQMEGIAELVVIPDNLPPEDQLAFLGAAFGREAEAAATTAEVSAARSDARERIGDGCVVSLATVYSGPSVAAWVAPVWAQPTSVVEAGCTLLPSPAEAPGDRNGRAFLSLELTGLLSAPTLVLLQTESVEGETAALEQMQADPLWQSLPAVQADRVIVLDRLGYAGSIGLVRFYDDLATGITAQ